MKILLVQSASYLYPWTGACKANKIMMEWLAEKGHECRVVHPLINMRDFVEDEEIKEKEHNNELELYAFNEEMNHIRINGVEAYTIKNGFRIIPFLRKFIAEYSPDVTLVVDDLSFVLLETVTETSTKSVFIAHTHSTLPFGPDSFDANPEKLKPFNKLNGVIAVSNFVRNYIQKWGEKESEVFYFPSYGDGPFSKLGNFDNKFVTIVNPSGVKGLSIFVELAERMPHVNFATVPTWATTAEEIEWMKTIPNIEIMKPVRNMDNIYKQTKILLMPSLWGESFGQVVVEGMLRGIPVIASNAGGIPEAKLGVDYILNVNQIKQYDTEHTLMGAIAKPIVPKQDILPWQGALDRLLEDGAHYEELSNLSMEKSAKFHASLSFEYLESYLRKVVDRVHDETRVEDNKNSHLHERLNMLSLEKRAQLMSMAKRRAEKIVWTH